MIPESILNAFELPEGKKTAVPYGNGHINDTYLVTAEGADTRYILQRINGYVFPKPVEVMKNMCHVTDYLREQIRKENGDPLRETLTLIPAKDGQYWATDSEGSVWRADLCVPDTETPEMTDTPEMLEECGRVFGLFSRRLLQFPADSLYETIVGFHDTPSRVRQLEDSVQRNAAGKLDLVQKELDFARERSSRTSLLVDQLREGVLPLRVTHNDTKVNNVLFDRTSGKAICVVDLDTVMPGLLAYDFGDAIRVGASTAEEDERDLSKVSMDLERYEAFARGYLQELGSVLNREEVLSLATGAWMMTLENGLRFLADHLNGDVYFKIHRPDQNLDRARAQFALAADMEKKKDLMEQILLKLM